MLNKIVSLLSHWKNLALVAAIIYIVIQQFSIRALTGQVEICQANLLNAETSIETAKQLSQQHEKELREREQEARKVHQEALKRADEIMKSNVPQDCEGTIRWMIDLR